MKSKTALAILLLFTSLVSAQPRFEVVSIKPVKDVPNGLRFSRDARRIHYPAANFRELVARAWRRKDREVDGPAWINFAMFNVDATYPAGPESQVPEMQQDLLAQRFSLRAHVEDRPTKGYALRVRPGATGLPKPEIAAGKGGAAFMGTRLEARLCTMGSFCDLLTSLLGAPVVDETGLKGNFMFTLSMRPLIGGEDDDVSDMIVVSLKQVGLTVAGKTITVTHVVVDSADQTPEKN